MLKLTLEFKLIRDKEVPISLLLFQKGGKP